MFSGQGSQYHGMGQDLYRAEPVFRETLDRLDTVAEAELGASVLGRMYDPRRGPSEPFDDLAFTHPAIVMVQLALADTLAGYGIEPDLLLGASLGEFTACVLAGVVDRDTCLRLLIRQARAARGAPPGGMLAVLGDERLHRDIPLLRDHTEVAARNYPGHLVLSGAADALTAAEELLRARDVACHRVPVPYAFHSALMDAGEPAFRAGLAETELRPPRIPIVSCAAMGAVDRVTPDHLWRATRAPIEFAATLTALERGGPYRYIDLGPSGTLHNFVRAGLPAHSRSRSHALLSPLSEDTRALAGLRSTVPARPLVEGSVHLRGAGAPVDGRPCSALRSSGPPRALPFDSGAPLRLTRRTGPAPQHPQEGIMKVYGFPGQGSQAKGMGKDLFDEFPEQTAVADAVLGYSIRELCTQDPRRELKLTQFTQPALYVVSALTWLRKLRDDPTPPDCLVGHSLGEYVALFAAGAFDFETGLRLVKRRGELMSRADGGRMAAVLGCDLDGVEQALRDHQLTGLDIANHNAPAQVVLAGPADQLDQAKPVFEGLGAHFVTLNVSAPFHSRYLRETADEFARYLDGFTLRDPRIPVIANVDARPYRPGEVKRTLARQIASTVRWTDTIRYLMGKGEFEFEELGPGRVLRKLVTKIKAEAEPLVTEPQAAEQQVTAPQATEPQATEPQVTAPQVTEPQVTAPQATAPPLAEAPVAAPPVAAEVAAAPGAVRAETLGAATFRERYGLRYACLAGAMYGGVSGAELLIRLAKSGGMGFFGSGGLALDEVGAGLDAVRAALGADGAYGANLLHQYADPERESALVDLFLRAGVRTIEASGFLRITPALVKYRLSGGRVLAKVSSTDMAAAFLEPAPRRVVRQLLDEGRITAADAERFGHLPMADDLCVEVGAGWYDATGTLATLLPAVVRLRDARAARAGAGPRIHVGAAGGIGSPEAAAAAFVLGAEFLVTGSINQCTPEAATSEGVKDLLQEVEVHDVALAPAPEMFELGVRAQVVKRGVLLPAKAGKLHELWRRHDSFEDIDAPTRRRIEEKFLHGSFHEAAAESDAGPGDDGKRRMATAFRSYLHRGFRLALRGDPERRVDYLVYCGPAMGAFNSWVAGTGLEPWRSRHVDTIAEHLMSETAALLRDRAARYSSSSG
ncbi:ACP S-malonyltransferase [Streptomyces sparsogenes]|uniref:ACP S-malonyltransferase n=1 Tax=Streptomyces sparsogenes TaxID=67365 RepID=UPI003F4D079E